MFTWACVFRLPNIRASQIYHLLGLVGSKVSKSRHSHFLIGALLAVFLFFVYSITFWTPSKAYGKDVGLELVRLRDPLPRGARDFNEGNHDGDRPTYPV